MFHWLGVLATLIGATVAFIFYMDVDLGGYSSLSWDNLDDASTWALLSKYCLSDQSDDLNFRQIGTDRPTDLFKYISHTRNCNALLLDKREKFL